MDLLSSLIFSLQINDTVLEKKGLTISMFGVLIQGSPAKIMKQKYP